MLINKLQVERFRGIRDLSISSLSRINLIVGDNNCGKTSLLEAIQLLRAPGSLADVYKIAKLRDAMSPYNSNSVYDNFICMFPKDEEDLKIQLCGKYNETSDSNTLLESVKNTVSYVIEGTESKELLDISELSKKTRREFDEANGITETDVFEGQSTCMLNGVSTTTDIRLNRLSLATGTQFRTNELMKINYVSPFQHLKGSDMDRIVRDSQYKKKCLLSLQLFDTDIEDMAIFRSDLGNRPVDYLKHKRLGNMPLSIYGDGIKKFLVLSNEIARTANGILLIDEIESSIHKQYYDRIFRFLVNACKEYNVQAFVTTHSLEAVDGLLSTQDYETQDGADDVTVVTLKREDNKTYSRALSGRRVYKNREAFDFEVRL